MDEQKNTVKIQSKNSRSKMLIIIGVAIAAIVAIVGILIAFLGENLHTHDYGDWETVKEATATEKGEERKYCSCGEYKSREVPALDNKKVRYEEAMALIQSRNYKAAYDILRELGDYSKAKDELGKFYYLPTKNVLTEDSNGVISERANITYTYGEANLPIKITSSSNEYIYISEYNYDKNGKLIYQKNVYDDYCNILNYIYDDNGYLIQEIRSDSYGNRFDNYIRDYTYDLNGNLLKCMDVYGDGSKGIFDYAYDSKGRVIKYESNISTNAYVDSYTINYIYDARGNLIKKTEINTNGYTQIDDYTYDVNNNLIKELQTYSGRSNTIEYTYDINNNLIKKVSVYSSGEKFTTNYVYDDNGNLIRFSGADYTVDYIYDQSGNVVQIIEATLDGYKAIEEYKYDLVYIPFDLTEDELDDLWERLGMYHKQ